MADTPENYARIAAFGREFWNRWVRTGLDALAVQATDKHGKDRLRELIANLKLADVTPLAESDWRDKGLDRLPELATVTFRNVDFGNLYGSRPVIFSGFVFPPQMSFAGATFGYHVRFKGSTFGDKATFADATFGVDADFTGATFSGRAHFDGATFGGGAHFDGATFGGWTRFAGATFGDGASFDGATFGGWTRFDGATFGGGAHFDGATFGDQVRCDRTTFGDRASFDGATFGAHARFNGATFGKHASFGGATFGDWARFAGATFGLGASFEGRTEDQLRDILKNAIPPTLPNAKHRDAWVNARLSAAKPNRFGWISFAGANFLGECSFIGRVFAGPVGFQAARFGKPPEFAGTEGHGFIDPHGMSVSFPRRWWWPFANRGVQSETSARIRRLRKIMADIHAQDVERALFILERRAERAIAWNGVAAKPLYLAPWRFLKTSGLTLLQVAYQALSNFGRSIVLPFVWLFASVAGFHAAYWQFWAKPVRALSFFDRDLISYSLGNLLPFVNTLSPARGEVLKRLFCPTDVSGACVASRFGEIIVPIRVELLALGEGIINAVLLFLLLQAIRNYFKMK